MADKEQMGEEKPVSSIGSSMCQTFFDLIMLIQDANGVSEVKNLVERCVKHPEEKGMHEIQSNARGSFLHGNLSDRWSRGLSFAKEMVKTETPRRTHIFLNVTHVITDHHTHLRVAQVWDVLHLLRIVKVIHSQHVSSTTPGCA